MPEHCVIKSAAALSRFMNEYGWPTRAVIRATRKHVLKQLLKYAPVGKRPHLQVIIDLTTLEKRGKFKAFAKLIQILHGKRGLHIVVMYLVVGTWRVPWAFRPWRGKDTVTPAQLVKRFVISTRVLKGSTITWWGRRRWATLRLFQDCQISIWLG